MRVRATLLCLTLAGLALRVHGLQHQSFWLDEVDAIALAGADVGTQLGKLWTIGENGALYFLLFKGWLAVSGTSEFGARFLSAMASTLVIPLLGAVTWRLFHHRPTTVVAAALAAVSPYYVWYAQDAKMYSLFAALALASQYCFLHGFSGRRPWPWWAGYVVYSSFALYVHLFAVLQIAATTAAGVWLWPRHPAGRWGFALATACLVLPYVPLALWQAPVLLRGANVGYRPADLQIIAVTLLEQLTWHLHPPPDRRWLLPLGAVLLWGLWRSIPHGPLLTARPPTTDHELARRAVKGRPITTGHGSAAPAADPAEHQAAHSAPGTPLAPGAVPGVLALWLAVPVAVTLVLQGTVPVFRDRYLIPLLAPLLILLARAIAPPWHAGNPAGLAAAVFVGGGFGFGLLHRPPNPDFRSAAAVVRELAAPVEPVGFLAGYAERPFDFYFRQRPGSYEKVRLPYTNYPDLSESDGLRAVATSLRGGRWLWIVRFEDWLWDGRDLTGQYLANRGARVVYQRDFHGVSVTRYEMPPGT